MGTRTLICLGIFLLFIEMMGKVESSKKSSQIFGDQIKLKSLMPRRPKVQNKIVLYHNNFRSKVKPKASNMLKMKWHKTAARAAQDWAEKCVYLTHNSYEERKVTNLGACGQNIFVSSHRVTWLHALQSWFSERKKFSHGKPGNVFDDTGHYTQMVWATSHRVGCGIARCVSNIYETGEFYNYVCNYCPGGNRVDLFNFPYERGKPCGRCKRYCDEDHLCTNPCPYKNNFIDCRELNSISPRWVCGDTKTEAGQKNINNCVATCKCRGKIYE